MKGKDFSIFRWVNRFLWLVYIIELYIFGSYVGLCSVWILFGAIIEVNSYFFDIFKKIFKIILKN